MGQQRRPVKSPFPPTARLASEPSTCSRFASRPRSAEDAFPMPVQTTNGDEQNYPNFIGNFSKGLPHNKIGEVSLIPPAYQALLNAVSQGTSGGVRTGPTRWQHPTRKPFGGRGVRPGRDQFASIGHPRRSLGGEPGTGRPGGRALLDGAVPRCEFHSTTDPTG